MHSMRYRYAGEIDAIGRGPGGELVVLDWKTSNAIKDTYAMQLAAYAHALEEMEGEKVQQGWVVRFDKTAEHGLYEARKIRVRNTHHSTHSDIKDMDKAFDLFRSALNLFNALVEQEEPLFEEKKK